MKLVFLIANNFSTSLTQDLPYLVKVDEKAGTWTFSPPRGAPETFKIGQRWERSVYYSNGFVLGVFDMENLEHIKALLEASGHYIREHENSLVD